MAIEAKKSQKGDTAGTLWVALAVEQDPQGRGVGTLLVEVGAGGGEGGGAGVLNSGKNGRICWLLGLKARMS